jgi:DNA replicative helicase MCM subunit Mcm2 (Cdc46/Mcm family)
MRQNVGRLDGCTACITTTVKTECVVVHAANPIQSNKGDAWR